MAKCGIPGRESVLFPEVVAKEVTGRMIDEDSDDTDSLKVRHSAHNGQNVRNKIKC